MKALWHMFLAAVFSVVLGFLVRANATTIIGDSHVGGLRPYLIKHMRVYFKNGSTASYWIKRKITDGVLIVMTGTNDALNDVPVRTWVKRTDAICNGSKRCFVVAPPVNDRGRYQPYRDALLNRKDVIWTYQERTRDGVHYYPAGYRRMANDILKAVR